MKTKRFGVTIKETRLRLGLRQDELARLSGVGQTSISNLEQGWKPPTSDNIIKICKALELDPDDYIEGEKDRYIGDIKNWSN